MSDLNKHNIDTPTDWLQEMYMALNWIRRTPLLRSGCHFNHTYELIAAYEKWRVGQLIQNVEGGA